MKTRGTTSCGPSRYGSKNCLIDLTIYKLP